MFKSFIFIYQPYLYFPKIFLNSNLKSLRCYRETFSLTSYKCFVKQPWESGIKWIPSDLRYDETVLLSLDVRSWFGRKTVCRFQHAADSYLQEHRVQPNITLESNISLMQFWVNIPPYGWKGSWWSAYFYRRISLSPKKTFFSRSERLCVYQLQHYTRRFPKLFLCDYQFRKMNDFLNFLKELKLE